MSEAEMTSEIEAELRLVDEALESGAIRSNDPLERELQELALAVRAEAPEPSGEFAAELRGRVKDGFPRERGRPGPFQRLGKLRRPPAIMLAGAASLIVALAVVADLRDGGGDGAREGSPLSRTGGGSEGAERAPLSGRRGEGGDTAVAPSLVAPEPPPRGPGFAPGERRRRIERSASLTLAAPAEQLDDVADRIVRLTDRYDGFVLRSSLSTGGEGTTGGDFELRVPAERLQAVLGELSKLADVRSRTQSGQDVTREFATAEDRLEAARAERRSLLRRLERAPSDSAAEAIRRRLDLNAGEIRGLRGQVRDLRTRTNYAAVTVSLQEAGDDGGASTPGSDDGLGGAVDDALASLGASVEILVRVLGVAIPLGLVAAALGFAGRALRRRRREAALSG
jgi:hypothetical protein